MIATRKQNTTGVLRSNGRELQITRGIPVPEGLKCVKEKYARSDLSFLCESVAACIWINHSTFRSLQDWYSDCSGTITRVDKDGKMCDVKVSANPLLV